MTYNVFWAVGRADSSHYPNVCGNERPNICERNIVKVIRESESPEIIAFQELSGTSVEFVRQNLHEYDHYSNIQNGLKIHTFIKNTYRVTDQAITVTGGRDQTGTRRPVHAFLINNKIAFVNIHGSHDNNNDIDGLTSLLGTITCKWDVKRIIMAGDFNMDFYRDNISNRVRSGTRTVNFGKHKFHLGEPRLKTCCSATKNFGGSVFEFLYGNKLTTRFDWVMDTHPILSETSSSVWPVSDHAPVIATLQAF